MKLRFALVVLVLAALLTGCTGQPAAPKQSTDPNAVVIWIDAAHAAALKPATDQFTRATGTPTSVEVRDLSDIRTSLLAVAGTDRAPDLILGSSDWTGLLADNKLLSPVDVGARASDLADPAVRALSYQGQAYGVGFELDSVALLRNTDLAPDAPKTFDDLVKSGRALVDAKKAKAVVAVGDMRPTAADAFHLYALQTSFGAPVFAARADGGVDGHALGMAGDPGAKFASYLAGLATSKALDPAMTAAQARDLFLAGQLPYWVTTPASAADVRAAKLKLAVDPVPPAGDKPAQVMVRVPAFFLPAKAKHHDAAQHLLVDYLTGPDAQARLAGADNRPPASKAALAAVTDKDIAAFGAVAAKGVPVPNAAQLDDVWAPLATAEADILTGRSTDPTGTWRTMCDGLQARIK